jgi:hypothetical protein
MHTPDTADRLSAQLGALELGAPQSAPDAALERLSGVSVSPTHSAACNIPATALCPYIGHDDSALEASVTAQPGTQNCPPIRTNYVRACFTDDATLKH